MKVSQKQANLLAKEVVKQLKAIRPHRVPEKTKAEIREWKQKRDELKKQCDAAEAALEKHDNLIESICGADVCGHWNMSQIISKMEEKNIPKVSEVEDEIILSAMFKNDGDMQSFISGIIKKYQKTLQQKIVAN